MRWGHCSFREGFPGERCKGWVCRGLHLKRRWLCVRVADIGPIIAIWRTSRHLQPSPVEVGISIRTSSTCTCTQSTDNPKEHPLSSPKAATCMHGRLPVPEIEFQNAVSTCFECGWRSARPSWGWPYFEHMQAASWCSCWDFGLLSRLGLHRSFCFSAWADQSSASYCMV